MSNKKYLHTNNIGERIRAYRNEKGYSSVQMSKILDISQGSLSGLENNKSKPSAETIANFIRHTDIDITWLLTGEETTNQQQVTRDPNIQKLLDITERVLTGPDQMAAEALKNSILYIGKCEEEKGDRAEGPKGDAGTIGG